MMLHVKSFNKLVEIRYVLSLIYLYSYYFQDELIRRLASDLRHTGEHSESVTEADRVTTHAASEEYNRPISPMTVQNIHAFEVSTK